MTNELELMAMGVVPYPVESPAGVPQWNAPRGTTIAESASGEYVLASDYGALEAERNELRVQVEAMRRVAMELRDYVGCEDVSHRAGEFHDFIQPCPVLARIDAALQAKP